MKLGQEILKIEQAGHERALSGLEESMSDAALASQDWATEPVTGDPDIPDVDNIAYVIHNLDAGNVIDDTEKFIINEIGVYQEYSSNNYDKKPVYMSLFTAPFMTSSISDFKFLGCSLNKQTPKSSGDKLVFQFTNLRVAPICKLLIFFVETPDEAKNIPEINEDFKGIKMAVKPYWASDISTMTNGNSLFYKIDGTVVERFPYSFKNGEPQIIRYPFYIWGQQTIERLEEHKFSYKHVSFDEHNQIKEGFERSIDAQSNAIRTENKLNDSISSINGSIDNVRLGLGIVNGNIADLNGQISTLTEELRYVNEDISDINTNISTHKNAEASTSTLGHVRLANNIDDTTVNVVATAAQVKTYVSDVQTGLNDHKSVSATTTDKGHVILADSLDSTTANAVATAAQVKAHRDTTAGTSVTGHVYIANDLNDERAGAVPTANQVKTYVSDVQTDLNNHKSLNATTTDIGHVRLASSLDDTTANVVATATQVKTHRNTMATASVAGHVKLGTGRGVPNDAGMVGTCSNGALAVRKASTDPTSGVGCVRIASSIKDTDTVSVPNAALVNASINAGADVAINGSDLRLLPADVTPNDGEYQAFYIPYNLLPSWQIECITIPSLLNVQTTPLYMAAYAVSPSDAMSLLSVSSNTQTWGANSERTWYFETPLSVPSGYGLRVFFIDNVANAANTSCTAISDHIKSHYIPSGSCAVRYSGVWYGGRTVDIVLSTKGHADILSTSTTAGHVYLAESENDARANAVPTIAQFKALLDRVAALETAPASVTLVTAPETTTT